MQIDLLELDNAMNMIKEEVIKDLSESVKEQTNTKQLSSNTNNHLSWAGS